MIPTVYLARGCQAAGKSTAARALAQERDAWIVSRDSIRKMLGTYRDFFESPDAAERERAVTVMEDAMILATVKAGRDVIVDEMNLSDRTPRRIVTMLWEAGIEVEYDDKTLNFLHVEPSVCFARNAEREGDACIPNNAVQRAISKAQKPAAHWDIGRIVDSFPRIEPVVHDPTLPECYIVDIDGTIANNDHRSPYDIHLCHKDTPYPDVVYAINQLSSGFPAVKIILVSGREQKYEARTRDWLSKHGVWFDELHMRATDDDRRDSIVKLSIFNMRIRVRYNVMACIDDRDRVVNIWRALGLRCWQVAEGAF